MLFRKFFIIVFIFTFTKDIFAFENKILLKINNEIITSVDVLEEIKYLSIIIKEFDKIEKEKIYQISINSLIRQKIKEIELSKNFKTLTIQEEYLIPQIDKLVIKNNFQSKDEFVNHLKDKGIDIEFINKRLSQEMLWNKLIYDKFFKNVKINKDKILENIKKNKTQNEYLLSEILFNVENKNKLNKKFEDIKIIVKNEGFDKAALIHSVSETSKNGGLLGWVKESSISKKIKIELEKIDEQNFTNPIQVPGGFIILYINETRISEKNVDFEKELNSIINEKTNTQLNQFSNIYFNKIKKNMEINEI
tara:strand:+ start:1271 stop:2191 length:921 start_codon:yes stop_codon:yes gene_type:complete